MFFQSDSEVARFCHKLALDFYHLTMVSSFNRNNCKNTGTSIQCPFLQSQFVTLVIKGTLQMKE
jgi:hypothetical protein